MSRSSRPPNNPSVHPANCDGVYRGNRCQNTLPAIHAYHNGHHLCLYCAGLHTAAQVDQEKQSAEAAGIANGRKDGRVQGFAIALIVGLLAFVGYQIWFAQPESTRIEEHRTP